MRLRSSLSIVGISFLVIYFVTTVSLEIQDVYSTEIALTLYSDYEFNEKMKSPEFAETLHIVKLTEKDLVDLPIIRELIDSNLSKDVPKNQRVKIMVSYEELLAIHQYMAKKYASKYDRSPDEYIRINDEQENSKQFYHTFEAEIFTVDGKLYGFGRNTYPITDYDNVELRIGTQEMNYFIRDWEIADLTSEELKNMPKLEQAINEIGKYDQNVQSRKGVTEEEFEKYRQWAKSLNLVTDDSSIDNAFLEYDGKKYHIFFRDV